jgi:hypothetical protein
MWTRGDRERAVVTKPVELLAPIGISAGIVAVALINIPLLYAPFAVGLLVAAVGVFWLLATVVVAVVTDRAWSCRTPGDLTPLALRSLVAAIATVGALSGLRFAAEQVFGLSRLT